MTSEEVEALAKNLENHWRDLIPGILLSPEERDDLDKDLTAASQALRELSEQNRKMRQEMQRFLPLIERVESDPDLWLDMTEGSGIATANGYRAALEDQ